MELEQQLEQAREQIRTLTLEKSAQSRNVADFNRVSELLGKPADVVLELQAVIQQREDLKRENADLLEETIKSKVAEKVKVDAARPIIIEQVKAKKPVTRTDVVTAVEQVLGMESVKSLLKYGLTTEMGDPQPANRENPSKPASSETASVIIPG